MSNVMNTESFFKLNKLGIAIKTSLLSSIVVFTILAIACVILLNFEANLANSIIGAYVSKIEEIIDKQGEAQKKKLDDISNINTEIAGGISSTFLYNVDSDGLKIALKSFLKFQEIKAIKVVDSSNEPFAAIWKTPEWLSGDSIPKNIALDDSLSAQADSMYKDEMVGKVTIYYTDALLKKHFHQGKVKAQSDISTFQNTITERINTAFVSQIITAFCVVLVLVATIIICLKRLAINPINRIIVGLNVGADQVASSSAEIAFAGQSLAEGSSEQAASIEETSASLEEMSSMTKQNAGNAHQADNLMKKANQIVDRANESMGKLTTSMEEISNASEETSKIIKTIDEIAFQTNLLALNAAVEAARAGEAGAGFAVVADEVRNLAMRAADAARNTADLIEGTVKKVKDGSDLVNMTDEAFIKVAESAAKVGDLVAEIAEASSEQAQGIEQVNTSVSEMDRVVQQNASSAEESASAAEEMNSQAEQMKGFVRELISLVGGDGNDAKELSQEPIIPRIEIMQPLSGIAR